MSDINPLTFLDNSSIIDYKEINRVSQQQLSDETVKKEFYKLLLEKVLLKDYKLNIEYDNSEDSELAVFSDQTRNDIVNDLFRQRLAEQLIDDDIFGVE